MRNKVNTARDVSIAVLVYITKGVVLKWSNPLILQPEQSGGQGSISGRVRVMVSLVP